jgi:hypothetical protein
MMFTDDEMQIVLKYAKGHSKTIIKDMFEARGMIPDWLVEQNNQELVEIHNAITRWNAAKPSYRVE